MGLVIHAPAGPPPGIAHKQSPPGNAAETLAGDIFAALLAELFAPADAAAPAPATDVAKELRLPGDPKPQKDQGDSDPTNSALLAAVTAMQASLAPATVANDTDAAAISDVTVAEVTATPQLAAPAVPTDTPQPADGAVDAEIATQAAPTAAESESTEAASPLVAEDAPAPSSPAADAAPIAAPPTVAPPSASASQQVNAPVAESADSADAPEAPKDARTRPADSSQSQPATEAIDSVVRNVGNAEHEPEGKSGDAPGHQAPKPQPNASAQGIAHAAENSAVGRLRTETATETLAANSTQSSPASHQPLPTAVEQVARTIIERAEHGGGEARLHLHPEELGEVTIHVHADGDAVRVEVHAERSEAMHLLRDSTTDLSALLGSRGLNLSGVHVGLGGQGSRGSHGYEPERLFNNRPGRDGFASLMGIGDSSAALHNRVRTAYNPDGAHVYRV